MPCKERLESDISMQSSPSFSISAIQCGIGMNKSLVHSDVGILLERPHLTQIPNQPRFS